MKYYMVSLFEFQRLAFDDYHLGVRPLDETYNETSSLDAPRPPSFL